MDDVLRTLLPFVGGVIVAGIGYLAVHQQNKTQRETLKQTTDTQADQQRKERLTAWRRERYGELSAAFGEFQGALRSMNLALNSFGRTYASTQNQAARDDAQTQLVAAATRFRQVNMSSRVFEASQQVADKEVAELAHKIADTYFGASSHSVAIAASAQLPNDEARLAKESDWLKNIMAETDELTRQLNRRIEKLISAGD